MTTCKAAGFFFLLLLPLNLPGAATSFELTSLGESVDDILDILIPTSRAPREECRRHSNIYREELKKLKLWATEMFDASSKFPSGVLFGSQFDFGNFDECVEVRVPLEGEAAGEDGVMAGQYCMAKFRITPPESLVEDTNSFDQKFYYQLYENANFINASTWGKILAFQNDRSRNTRNDFYFSYCIPSSCLPSDLETPLRDIAQRFNDVSEFKISVSVDGKNCQLKDNSGLSTGDLTFMSIVAVFVVLAVAATGYDFLGKLEGFERYQIEGTKHKVIMAFSVFANLKKLSSSSENSEGLDCIHGMKVISMFLIIMGHRIMFTIGTPLLNSNFVEKMYERVEATVLLNGPIIVDTFFNISGFLACYLLLMEMEKRRRGVNFLILYLHRFIRLTPAYAVVLAFYCTLFIKTGSGPFWTERIGVEQERCVASWWANLFYLNNYFNTDKICMFQSWYMTCDMHFFLLTPFLVWLLRKRPTLGLATILGLIALTVGVVFATVYVNNEDGILLLYMKLLRDPVVNNTFKNTYIPTHMRASPYLVGMITGYIKYKMRTNGTKIPKFLTYLAWFVCVLVIEATVYFAFIFYIPGKEYDPLISAFYASLHHVTWSVCISWMIIAVSEGSGAWIEPILSWRPLILMSRVTYTAFLCHGAIQIYSAAILRHSTYCTIFVLVFNTAGDITLAYISGFVLSMLFESPIIGLEKIILSRERTAPKPKEDATIPTVIIPKVHTISQPC